MKVEKHFPPAGKCQKRGQHLSTTSVSVTYGEEKEENQMDAKLVHLPKQGQKNQIRYQGAETKPDEKSSFSRGRSAKNGHKSPRTLRDVQVHRVSTTSKEGRGVRKNLTPEVGKRTCVQRPARGGQREPRAENREKRGSC